MGGLRTPAVDVPIARLSGVDRNPDSGGIATFICMMFGSTKPFDQATLQALYPTHQDYVDKVTRATDAAIAAGFLLPADKDEIVSRARAAAVP